MKKLLTALGTSGTLVARVAVGLRTEHHNAPALTSASVPAACSTAVASEGGNGPPSPAAAPNSARSVRPGPLSPPNVLAPRMRSTPSPSLTSP